MGETKQEHDRKEQEWKRLDEERCNQAEQDKRQLQALHSSKEQEWKQERCQLEEQHSSKEQEWKRLEEERRNLLVRLNAELETQRVTVQHEEECHKETKSEHDRKEQEWKRLEEERH